MNLTLDYVPSDELLRQPASWWNTVLGVVGFDKPPLLDRVGASVPVTASMTPTLGEAGNVCEVWRIAGDRFPSLTTGSPNRGGLRFRYSDDLLFGSVIVREDLTGIDAGAVGGESALRRATLTVYEQIFAVLEETQHRHLIRIWNYLPEINGDADGDERYRQFNSARQAAFRRAGRSTLGTAPAACALGTPAGSPISIYFLAARRPQTMIENPRQTSAYFYPPAFGIHSPTFSRACVMRESAGTNLFVSGTASIVGHETRHPGDVTAQTHETLANIDALLDEANRVAGPAAYSPDGLTYKVYVRHASDLAAIERVVSAALPASTPIVYLQADVCREDLLVEIEATGGSRP